MDDVYNASTGPLGVVFVILLLHVSTSFTMLCMVPSGVVLARHRCRRTTPAQLPWELCSWSCYCVHDVYNTSTRAWSLGSCALWTLNCGRITASRPVNDLDVVRLLWVTTREGGSVCSDELVLECDDVTRRTCGRHVVSMPVVC